jgi:hypothetical protein
VLSAETISCSGLRVTPDSSKPLINKGKPYADGVCAMHWLAMRGWLLGSCQLERLSSAPGGNAIRGIPASRVNVFSLASPSGFWNGLSRVACFGIFSRRQEHPCRWGRLLRDMQIARLAPFEVNEKMPSLQISLSTSGCCLLSKLAAKS